MCEPGNFSRSGYAVGEKGNVNMVAAVIVLYYPELSLLQRLIETLVGQVDMILVIDNTPLPIRAVQDLITNCEEQIHYEALGDNRGIASAQNIGIRRGLEAGASHILLLDQDSALPPRMVQNLVDAESELLRQGNAVAAVGPVFADEKTGALSCAVRHGLLRVKRIQIDQSSTNPVESDNLIASGSLIRATVLQQVGLMREELFIDWVDVEWCHRARSYGFHSYIIPSIVMTHSIGDSAVRIFGKEINLHSRIRDFYIVRNATFLLREPRMGWRWRLVTMINVPKHIVVHSWFSQQKWKTLGFLAIAVMDGLRGNMKRFS